MTVGELIERLQQEFPDRLVVLKVAYDHSQLAGYWVGRYHAETTWYGEAYDYEDEDLPEGTVPALILKPIN